MALCVFSMNEGHPGGNLRYCESDPSFSRPVLLRLPLLLSGVWAFIIS